MIFFPACMFTRRWIPVSLGAVLWMGALLPLEVRAADPDLVGILASAIEPNTIRDLGLTENQVSGLQEIIKQRELKGLDLAQVLRELPSEERDSKKRAFVRESEQAGFAILNLEQRSKLNQLRLAKIGMVSLAEADVAQTLGLSEGQSKQVADIMAARSEIIREVGRDKAADTMNQRLKAVLTMSQFMTWQAMAGVPVRNTANASKEVTQATDATAQDKPAADKAQTAAIAVDTSSSSEDSLTLNFKETPWEDVLKWICKESKLSMVTSSYPQGTFTYADPYKKYTTAQAMDVMNGVLLREGFSLVRRDRALMMIDLSGEAEVVRAWLREISHLVPPEQLSSVGEFEICKCLFALSRLTADDAKKEIERLVGPQGSVIPLSSSGQILVCETGGKLRLIQEMLRRVEDPETAPGAKVVSINLEHVSADEVLAVVRPLVGLGADANTSTDFNVATDTFGTTIYASGKPEKLQILKEMSKKIDVATNDADKNRAPSDPPKLHRHQVMNGDLEMVYKVLETLLANSPVVRMSKDEKTNSIIAFGSSSDHDLITKTIQELSGEGSRFHVLGLKRIDPQTAIVALEKVFGKKSEKDTSSAIPTFIGDPVSRSLMVQCTPNQLNQIQTIIDKLEETGSSSQFGDNFRQLNGVSGKSAEKLLQQVESFVSANPASPKFQIRVINPSANKENKNSRRVPPPEKQEKADDKAKKPSSGDSSSNASLWSGLIAYGAMKIAPVGLTTAWLQQPPQSSDAKPAQPPQDQKPVQVFEASNGAEIKVFMGPTGLVFFSDDKQALAEFEQIARMISDQMAMAPPEPVTIYLRHIKAQAASELLRSILLGEGANGGGGGGLLGSLAGNALGELGGGMFRGLLGGGGTGATSSTSTSTSGIASGKPMIIPDPRLNALIVTATPLDLDLIEQVIEIIDQEDSPVENETRGTPQRIPIYHNDVEEIAKIVKELFKDRLGGDAAGAAGAQRQPGPQEFVQAMQAAMGGRGGRGGAGGGQSQLKEASMTIATDPKSNSLIVMAPPNLFEQVKQVVEMLDEASEEQQEETVVSLIPGDVNPSVVQRSLTGLFGAQVKTNSQNPPAATNTNTQNNNQNRQQGGQRNFQGFGGGNFGFPGGMQGFGGNRGGVQGFGGQNFGGGQGGNRQGGNQGGGNRGGQGGGNRGGGR